jgi:L-ascorbate metabolism protein UlaG (beta-lactamase superfamily)
LLIRWHGHSCFEIGDGNELTIVTDPHDGKSIGIKPPMVKGNIVLMSHDHFDHNCAKVVSAPGTLAITGAGEKTARGVKIKGVHSYHDEACGSKRGENIIFKFEVEGVKLCHLGDLGEELDKEQLAELEEIDVLFIPVGGTFTLDPEGAWQVIKALMPKVVVPMHYRVGGLSLSIQPVENFLAKTDKNSIVKVGNEIEFSKEDLPEKQEVWVFSL